MLYAVRLDKDIDEQGFAEFLKLDENSPDAAAYAVKILGRSLTGKDLQDVQTVCSLLRFLFSLTVLQRKAVRSNLRKLPYRNKNTAPLSTDILDVDIPYDDDDDDEDHSSAGTKS